MSEYTILPLINASFQPGEAKRTVAGFEDRDFQKIARAEYYYFTGQAEKCSHIAERYLMSHNIKLKMSFLPVICIFESDTWQSRGIQKRDMGDSGMS